MADISTTHTWDALSAELKTWLGVSGSGEDAQLRLYYSDALRAAQVYLGNPFTDEDGNDIDTLADEDTYGGLKLGLFVFVKRAREADARAAGVARVKTGDLEEQFSVTGSAKEPIEYAKPKWRKHRKKVWR